MTVSKDELKDAVGSAVATALFEHNRIMERHDAKAQPPINWKHLATSIIAAVLLGLTGWVFTTSNRVTLLESAQQRIIQDVASVGRNVEKILGSVQTIENTRFTASDWDTRIAPMANRINLVEQTEARQWENIRKNEGDLRELKFELNALKKNLDKVGD